jgi:predicted hydrocarbon binding protein
MATNIATTNIQQDAALKNWTLWSMLTATERVVGQENLATVLRKANLPQYIGNFPPSNQEFGNGKQSYFTRIEQAITDIYGARGANAILLAIGKEHAQNAMKELFVGITSVLVTVNSFLPKGTSLKIAAEQMSRTVNELCGTQFRAVEENGILFIDDPACVHCMDRQADFAICTFQRGFLKTCFDRTKSSLEVQVEEVLCKAKGDATCRYRISLGGESQPPSKQPDVPKPI